MTIFKKLFISITTLIFITSLTNILFVDILGKRSIEKIIEQDLKNSTDSIINMVISLANVSVEDSLKVAVEKNFTFIAYLYQEYWEGYITEDEAHKFVKEFISNEIIGKTGSIQIIDTKGNVLFKSDNSVEDKYTEQFIKKKIVQKKGYCEFNIKEEDHEVRKVAYLKFFEPWGWIVSANIDWKNFYEIINYDFLRENILNLKFGKNGYPFVLDKDRGFVIHPYYQGSIKDQVHPDYVKYMDTILHNENGKMIYYWKDPKDDRPQKKMVIYNCIPELGWIVASSAYLSDFSKYLISFRIILFIGSAVIIFMLFFILYYLSDKITKPITVLKNTIEKSFDGNYKEKANVISNDEIGELAEYFNTFLNKLQKAKKIKQEFLANMSHEIKTPMTHIIGYSELIKRNKIPEKNEEYLNIILKSSEKLLLLINNILEVSKITSDHLSDNKECFDVNSFMFKLHSDYMGNIKNREVNIDFNRPYKDDINICTDKIRLEMALTELINNAFKFSESGTIEAGYNLYDEEIVFYVKDNGIGIKKENFDVIFEDFYQIDASISRKYSGVGLGLSLVKKIVEYLNGSIWIESNYGNGSTFFIKLKKD